MASLDLRRLLEGFERLPTPAISTLILYRTMLPGVLQFSLHTPTNVSALMKDNVASEISNEVNALLSVW
ncbi:hypothetical protein PJK45_10295 [Mycobacterium kansasii]|uniref:Uncharacterized protein n=2 Tax=Mycobacterium kansasii TaxID=1768 RepID=A0A653F0L0_MYCKA|nr:hypothetical protein [Mycobacterium kansasii]MXO40526.1 hypothetical protein [Mycobacterium kansasii]UCA17592.1 hypothetical protein LA359_14835 [Mycobacterium kansasii]UGT82452.1 hypothetical protein LTS70_06890 [Mycobacterium kansasii]UGT86730.1 hypothetical protein LTT71_00290 [Mycobacterium kansasii]UGU25003.1 hypothetical protein LT351_27195 [Mycobacterium kansasii]